MASEKNLSLLDDFLSNRMTEKEQKEFELKLDGDPELKEEFQWQKEIIQGIKKQRVAELKSMLNNISIASNTISQTSLLSKMGGIAIITGFVGIGLYFGYPLLRNDEKDNSLQADPIIAEEITPLEEITTATKKEDIPVAENEAPVETESAPILTEAKKKPTVSHSSEGLKKPITLFDPTREASTESTPPSNSLGSKARSSSALTVEINNTHKKYQFHYQFEAGKLYLFGEFDKDLYEILEFNHGDNTRSIYLNFNQHYYLLDETQEKITKLEPLSDQKVIKYLDSQVK